MQFSSILWLAVLGVAGVFSALVFLSDSPKTPAGDVSAETPPAPTTKTVRPGPTFSAAPSQPSTKPRQAASAAPVEEPPRLVDADEAEAEKYADRELIDRRNEEEAEVRRLRDSASLPKPTEGGRP